MTHILQQICHHYRFWKISCFFQKDQFSWNVRNLTIWNGFNGRFAIIWRWKIFTVRTVEHRIFSHAHIGYFQFGKRKKNVWFQCFEWMVLLPYYKYGRKITNFQNNLFEFIVSLSVNIMFGEWVSICSITAGVTGVNVFSKTFYVKKSSRAVKNCRKLSRDTCVS